MDCPNCHREDVGEITFSSLGSGTSFFFCRYCEHRWWVLEAKSAKLGSVLEAASVFAKAS
jgi:hypothetical protein